MAVGLVEVLLRMVLIVSYPQKVEALALQKLQNVNAVPTMEAPVRNLPSLEFRC